MTNEQHDSEDRVPELSAIEASDDVAEQVKGGAKTQPAGPIPIPYPNTGNVRGVVRSIEPCI